MAEPFTVLYNLADPEQWNQARRHRAYWGRRFTDIEPLDNDRIVLHFRPSEDTRWRAWEEVRKGWILQDAEPRQYVRPVEDG